MKYKIIGDSCLDLTKEMRKDPVYTLIPFTLMVGDRQFVDDESGRVIANAFGQFYPGRDYRPESLKSALHEVALFARKEGLSVAVPYKISCGICGGDWDEVQKILAKTMKNVRCVIYRRPED